MLQKLNERIQGIVAWVVVVLIAVTFTLFGVDYYLQSRHISDAEVTVNGQPISKQSFEVNYRRERQQQDPTKLSTAAETALKKQVRDEMVTNLVTVQAAQKAGFDVSIEQANAAILSIPQFQQDGHFSAERYQQALSSAMFTAETFQKEVRQGMLLNQQRFAFIGTSFALHSEIKRFVKLYMQTRDYQYLLIPAKLFSAQSKVNENDIENYYKSHPKQFVSPEKVSIDYVRLSFNAVKSTVKVNAKQVEHYYDENQNNYLTPAQWQVAHILFAVPQDASTEDEEQIRQKAQETAEKLQENPVQFAEMMKTLSADKLSIANGGILPWIRAGETGFDKALTELSQPGQISPAIKTQNGYEIFKLVAYKPAKLKPLAEVQAQISEQLLNETTQAKYAQLLEQLTDQAYQTPDSLNAVAENLNVPVEQTELFDRQGGSSEITKNKQVVNTAFSHDVLELGNNSEPLQLDNDSVIVIRIQKHIPAAVKPLTAVRDEIAAKLDNQQAAKKAQELGTQLLSLKTNTQEDEKIVVENKLQWQIVEKATRDTDKADAVINDLAFNLAKANNENGKMLPNGDFVIVKLVQIANGKIKSLDKEQLASISQQIEANYGLMDYDLYVNNLMALAKIEN